MADSNKMSEKDRRAYGNLGQRMQYFHNSFRHTYQTMMEACEKGQRPAKMSIRQFIAMAEEFCQHLTMHHTIEEQHIFPFLATKMPAFRKELELLDQHKQIHAGIDRLEEYFTDVKSGAKDLRLEELKEILNSFGPVLWSHLEDEEHQLTAENMRKYWTLEELKRLPM